MRMSYSIGVITVTCIYMIAVLGVSILTGFTGLFSLGHAGFMAIGGYVSGILSRAYGVPMPMAILLGMAGAVLVGLLIGYPSLKLKGDYFIIATLGIGEAILLLIQNMNELTGGAIGYTDLQPINGMKGFYLIMSITVVCIVFCAHFTQSKIGRNLLAIREDDLAAETVGIYVYRHKMLAMGISCALCGLSGALLGHYMSFLHPSMFSGTRSNELVICVFLGGAGSLTGSIVAACILLPLPEILRTFFGSRQIQEWRMVFYGIAVVLVILFRPQGLMGNYEFSLSRLSGWFVKIVSGRKRNEFF
jgi:branched-chain amino acid transport system permease protein